MFVDNLLFVILAVLVLVLYLATAILLGRKYLRTHDVGFVWLCAAVVVWPVLTSLLEYGRRVLMDRNRGREAVFFPFSLVQHGQVTLGSLVEYLSFGRQLVGVALVFVAVLYLCKSKSNVRVA